MDPVDEDIQHEMNRELGGREQAEIDRRVKRALERREAIPAVIVEKAAQDIDDYFCGDHIDIHPDQDEGCNECDHARLLHVRQILAAVYADIQAEAMDWAAEKLRTVAAEVEGSGRRDVAEQIVIENTRHDATILDQRAAELRAGGA